MGLSFSIGGTAFAALSSTGARSAMEYAPESPQQGIARFHVPGSDGNYIVREGRAGVKIRLRFRYIGTLSAVFSALASDRDAWANVAVTIAGPDTTYQRCQLEPGSMRIVRAPVAKGDGTNVSMDVEAVFTSDA